MQFENFGRSLKKAKTKILSGAEQNFFFVPHLHSVSLIFYESKLGIFEIFGDFKTFCSNPTENVGRSQWKGGLLNMTNSLIF